MEPSARMIRQDKRKRQILSATLRLVRRHGTGISTAQIAAEARCSKETLYAWFSDRDGLMHALVEEQARHMGDALARSFARADGESFEARLHSYCLALIDFLTGEAVLAVNRIAMADACRDGADLGLAVLDDWQARVVAPFLGLLKEGRENTMIEAEDLNEAFNVLMGLLIGDRQRRLLLGEASRPTMEEMSKQVDRALVHWFTIYRK